jgi:hypothetical protein
MGNIIKLSELPRMERILREKAVLEDATFIRPAINYNFWGLRFPLNYLEKIGGSIILLPLEFMADYVDRITKKKIDQNDHSFIRTQVLPRKAENEQFEKWNATSLGNTAYTTLHCQNEQGRHLELELLEKYYVWFRQNVGG